MMVYYPNVDPAYIYKRKGDSTDPFIPLQELLIVDNGRVTLNEIPDFVHKVQIKKADGTPLSEVTSDVSNANQFKVDYSTGLVTLDESLDGATLTINYYGTGYVSFPASRIKVDTSIDNIENQSIQDLVRDMKNSRTNWLIAVDSYDEISTTYPNPKVGDTVQTMGDGKIYRFTGDTWINNQAYSDTALTSIQLRIDNLEKTPNEYEWTANAGQLTYVMPENTTYNPNTKWLEVNVGGAQISPSQIQKDNSNQFTLLVDPSYIPEGVKVIARWVEPYIPAIAGHKNTHEVGGYDEIDVTKLKNYDEQIANNFNNVNAQLADLMKNAALYTYKQTIALGKVIDININNKPITVACQGDSLTKGGQEGGVNPYPTILQNRLNEFTGNQATVINRGYSGDTTEMGYNRWTDNPNADIHLLMYGMNDAWNGKTIEQSISDYCNLIKRILDWGSAVVLITPPKKKYFGSDILVFNTMVKRLGEMFNIPVLDAAQMLEGYNANDIYVSDGVHLNDVGYYILSCKIASIFIGSSIIKNDYFRIQSNKHITMDGWRGYLRFNGISDLSTRIAMDDTTSFFGSGLLSTQGTSLIINAGETANIAFYADEDDLVLIPYFGINGAAQATIEAVFQSAKPKQVTAMADDQASFANVSTPSQKIAFAKSAVQNTYSVRPQYLRITGRGMNNLYIRNDGDSGSYLKFYGFFVMSYQDFRERQREDALPVVKSGRVTATDLTGRITYATPFISNAGSIVTTSEEYQTLNGKITIYNRDLTGFNYTVDQIGRIFHWIAVGK